MKALDLDFDLGGCTIGLKKAGIDVVCAVGSEESGKEIFARFFENGQYITNNILEISVNDLPDIDIITGKLFFSYSISAIGNNNYGVLNDRLAEIIMKKRPKAFLIRVMDHLSKAYSDTVEKFARSCGGYECSVQTFEEKNYIECLSDNVQKYLIGIREDIWHAPLKVKGRILQKQILKFKLEEAKNVDKWYRAVYLDDDRTYEKDKYYLYGPQGMIETSKIIYTERKETYLVDELGVRRFTHNELASIKGLLKLDYNQCKKKRKAYMRIQNSCNAYIVQEIMESLINYFHVNQDTLLVKKKSRQNYENSRVLFPKLCIKKIFIKKLKGIEELELPIGEKLTAIMGVNGIGKSTILHALACVYSPYEKGDDYKFSFFFTPNPDMSWTNSKFFIEHYDSNNRKNIKREYKKDKDRWAPRYANRPKRDVYYIGIDSCIPEIERERQTSFINYSTSQISDNKSNKILNAAAYILNKEYDQLTINKTKKKELLGVKTQEDISYSSLSMGAGEQRVFRILQILYNAHQYSLILIDEIELLLHVTALHRLIKKIDEISEKNSLQVIFTTHSMEMAKLQNYAQIRYLRKTSRKTMVYNTLTSDLAYELTSQRENEVKLYVEDLLAEIIVKRVAFDLGILKNVETIKYGAARNAFVLSAGFMIDPDHNYNKLIIMDGDIYKSEDDKKKELRKLLTGTEETHDEKLQNACQMISQFNLPENKSPERNIYEMLIDMDSDNELVEIARNIHAVDDNHEWLSEISDTIGYSRESTYERIIDIVSEHERWEYYVENVRSWLLSRKEQMKPLV